MLTREAVNGDAFFAGLAMTCLGAAMRSLCKRPYLAVGQNTMIIMGFVVTVASGTPLPLWAYILWTVLLLVAALSARRAFLLCYGTLGLFVAVSTCMAVVEFTYHLSPKLSLTGVRTLIVLGDSLSGGAKAPGKNWPEALGELLTLPVKNLSTPGVTAATALPAASTISEQDALVLVEIGGNDLLGRTRDFSTHLERILSTVCKPGRQVVMLELPIPPFHNNYGAAQRRLARTFGVPLIPKRWLASVLATPGATVDGLHLSNEGHELLAKRLSSVFSAAR